MVHSPQAAHTHREAETAVVGLTERELLVEALKWLRGGEDRRGSRFSTNYGLIRAISEAVGDVRSDED